MTHYVTNHILFPRRRNFSLLTQPDVETIWLIENKVKLNCAKQVIDSMMKNKKEEAYFSFRNLIAKILEET